MGSPTGANTTILGLPNIVCWGVTGLNFQCALERRGWDPTHNKRLWDLCLASWLQRRPPQARKAWKRSGLESVARPGGCGTLAAASVQAVADLEVAGLARIQVLSDRTAPATRACRVGIVGLFRGLEDLRVI